ncbi:RNA pseudouridine synthase, partial [Patescibacteria group bacterium]|nr:RNA pseudouridine synthase [Patescibacteria group bacterium]
MSSIKKLKYKLLHEEKDYLIVEKPAGMLTHSADGELGLADMLLKDYPEIEGVGEEYRWGIVHRLDRDVSGALLAARTKKFFKHIKAQFKERKVKKIYLALVYGNVERDEGDINFRIARSKSGKMAARPETQEGKEAATYFDVPKHFRNYAYLRVQILTGRTHQIRAHMLAYGHPIVGDKIYRARKQKIKLPCELDRIFLHSHLIGFEDLDGKWVEYKSELPKKLKE